MRRGVGIGGKLANIIRKVRKNLTKGSLAPQLLYASRQRVPVHNDIGPVVERVEYPIIFGETIFDTPSRRNRLNPLKLSIVRRSKGRSLRRGGVLNVWLCDFRLILVKVDLVARADRGGLIDHHPLLNPATPATRRGHNGSLGSVGVNDRNRPIGGVVLDIPPDNGEALNPFARAGGVEHPVQRIAGKVLRKGNGGDGQDKRQSDNLFHCYLNVYGISASFA